MKFPGKKSFEFVQNDINLLSKKHLCTLLSNDMYKKLQAHKINIIIFYFPTTLKYCYNDISFIFVYLRSWLQWDQWKVETGQLR